LRPEFPQEEQRAVQRLVRGPSAGDDVQIKADRQSLFDIAITDAIAPTSPLLESPSKSVRHLHAYFYAVADVIGIGIPLGTMDDWRGLLFRMSPVMKDGTCFPMASFQ